MTPQEKDLIQSVFDRLAAQQGAKDSEAERLIKTRAASQPDALYGLVQAVVMLEAGLNQAQSRIGELQRQIEQQSGNQGGSFLGATASPWAGGSVPRSGAPYAGPQPAPQPAPQPVYYAPPQPAPVASPWAQPASGGSFLRNAATMAAGVAGGTLIAEGISSMLGGHHYGGGFGGYGGGFGGGYEPGYGGPAEVVENVTVNNYYDHQVGGGASVADDASLQQASYDVDDGGGYDDGVDI